MKKLALYILGLFILTSATAYAIGAAPLRVEFTSQPGETVHGQVNVFNDSDSTQTIVVGKGDFLVNGYEEVEFYEDIKEDNLYSLQEWITIPNNKVTLGPRKKGVIPYEITVPINAPSQGYYGSLFIETKPDTTAKEIAGATISVRVAHLVLLKVEGDLYEKINIDDFSVVQQNDQGLTEFDVVVVNKGNIHNSPTGEIEVIDEQGKVIQTLPINEAEYNVLPESKKTYKANCNADEIPAGHYYVTLHGNTDAGDPLEAEMKIRVSENHTIDILEKNLEGSNGRALKEMLSQTRIIRNSIIAVIGILLLTICFVAITKYCFKCSKFLNEKKTKKRKPKKRLVKGKKK